VKLKNKSDTNNNKGNWNRLKIIQKIPEQHTQKARHQGGKKKTGILGTVHVLE
jgi:hypothetical protein